MVCILIFDDIFSVWTHVSHLQICDCVGVFIFGKMCYPDKFYGYQKTVTIVSSHLTESVNMINSPCHCSQYTQSKHKLNLKFCCCVWSRTMSCRHMMMNSWPWHCHIMGKIIFIFKGTNYSDLLIANNFLECGLLFLQYHQWSREVARTTKANSWMPSKKLLTSKKFAFSCDNQAATFLIPRHSVFSYDLLTLGVWLEYCLQQSGFYIPL
jgi:hypothetical protein